jgi:folate-dependent phosphoribosylglycinamide formyltransferase PurN
VLCTRGGLFGALVLRELRACDRLEVCGIVRSSRMFHPSLGPLRGSLAYLRRSGVAYSVYLWCATTLADVVCRLAWIGCVPTRTRPRGVPVHTTRDINDPKSLEFLGDCTPDLLVSAFFDQRLTPAVLAVPARGCLNIHPSLLPWFKGVDPVLQARLVAGHTGVSVHYMTPRLDAGAILAQQPMAVSGRVSVFTATAQLYRAGAKLLVNVIDRVLRGEAGTPQSAPGTYQSWPSRADIRALRRSGGALIRPSDLMGILNTGRHRSTRVFGR